MNEFRKKRLNEQLKREISTLIFKEIKDPRIKGFVTVTEVDIATDMKTAKVYISIFGIKEESKKKCLKGLQNSSPFLQYKLSKQLRIRYIPNLQFKMDSSIEKGFSIIEKLENIKNKKRDKDD